MRKVIGLSSFVAVLCLFVAGGPDPAFGQAKGKTTPTTKKEERKVEAKAGTVEVHKAKDGYRFRVKDADGKTVAMCTKGYEEKADCLKALDFVKATLAQARPTEVKE